MGMLAFADEQAVPRTGWVAGRGTLCAIGLAVHNRDVLIHVSFPNLLRSHAGHPVSFLASYILRAG